MKWNTHLSLQYLVKTFASLQLIVKNCSDRCRRERIVYTGIHCVFATIEFSAPFVGAWIQRVNWNVAIDWPWPARTVSFNTLSLGHYGATSCQDCMKYVPTELPGY